jgi:hypothetical protein
MASNADLAFRVAASRRREVPDTFSIHALSLPDKSLFISLILIGAK